MEEKLEITDHDEDQGIFENYKIILDRQGVSIDNMVSADLLVLPAKYDEDNYYFAQETVDFVKFCKQNDTNIEIVSPIDIKVRSLHSFDIWMPIIYIASSVLLPLVVNLISNFIYDKMKGREHEEAEVEVKIVIKNGKKEKMIQYKGDAKTFKETFDKLDLN